MPHLCENVNVWAVLVSTLAAFIIGGLWYSPVLFANAWTKGQGWSEAQCAAHKAKGCAGPFATALITYGVMAWIMSVIATQMKMPGDWMCALGYGFTCWLGFSMPITLTNAKFSGTPTCVWAIDAGYSLVSLIAMAEVLLLWPRG